MFLSFVGLLARFYLCCFFSIDACKADWLFVFVVPEATRFASPREELHRVWRRVTYVYKSGVTPRNKYNNSPGIRLEDQLLIVQVASCVIFVDTHLQVTIDSPLLLYSIPNSCILRIPDITPIPFPTPTLLCDPIRKLGSFYTALGLSFNSLVVP